MMVQFHLPGANRYLNRHGQQERIRTIASFSIPKSNAPSLVETRRKHKYISHESAVAWIKRENDPQEALSLFNTVGEQNGFFHNHATYSVILVKLARAKKFDAVDALLNQMRYETCKFHENIFIKLMKYLSKFSLHERVVELFCVIQPIIRAKPSLRAVSTCLNLLADSNRLDLARWLLLHCRNSLGLELNSCMFNILIKYHCKNGDMESAHELVFKQMRKTRISCPNLITYSTLIDGFCRCGRLKEAVHLFEVMISGDSILPDALTYGILVNGFCQWGKVDQVKKIIEFMRSNGCNPNVFHYAAMMNVFCKEGKVEEARGVFGEMRSNGLRPDAVNYTTFINCLCKAGKTDEALNLLEEMKNPYCRPDTITFNVLLRGLCMENRPDEALMMLQKLVDDGVYLNKGSYRMILNILCQRGELEKATQHLWVMLGRGFLPHHATSNELLVRLCESKMVDDAVVALFRFVELGFKPESNSWAILIELMCRERKLLFVFQLVDELIAREPVNFHSFR